jgi:3',5'-cyclic AMP phosphodiesterase CpdA
MNIKEKCFLTIFVVFIFTTAFSQSISILVLGDIHYDLIGDHDMDWLSTKPDDMRQVTREYTISTEKYWDDFISVLKDKVNHSTPKVKAIVQAGDLSEGLAGNQEKALQMASNTMKMVDETDLGVPWIIAKGNHDVTGPGAADAFNTYYVPMFRKQTDNKNISNASYSYRFDNVQITCIDPWDKNLDMVKFLDEELSRSNSKFKFVVVHEPVIPVTERCWHTLRNDPGRREKLLEVIARNKAIVLCAHLHRYSVVARDTPYGPIVQVMVVSVVKDRNYQTPKKVITQYGASLAEALPEWEPATLESRKKILAEESRFVTYYKQTDLPGYGIIKIDNRKGSIELDYYAAFGKKPYYRVNLTEFYNK